MVGIPMEFPVDYIENGDGTARPVYANQNSRLRVQFKKVVRPDVKKMLDTGEECFLEEVLLVKRVKGDTNSPVSKATEDDKRRHRAEWEEFRRGEGGSNGHPLFELYGMRAKDVSFFASNGIYTIEQLIEAEPSQLAEIEGGFDLQELARIWVKARKKEDDAKNALEVLEEYKKKTEELEEKCLKLEAQLSRAKKARAKAKAKAEGSIIDENTE